MQVHHRQANEKKMASQMKTICTLEYREVENTHTKYNYITKKHIYIRAYIHT